MVGTPDLLVAVAIARTLVIGVSCALVALRVRRPAAEGSLWRSYALGLSALSLGSLVDVVVLVTGSDSPAGVVLLGLGALTTTFFLYRALLHWMRARTSTSGIGRADWLLGTGTAAAFTGLLLAGAAAVGHPLSGLEGNLRAFHLAALTVVLISTVVITLAVNAASNVRCWVAVAAVAAVLGAQSYLAFVPGVLGQVLVSAAWAGLAATYGVCALLPATAGGPTVPSPMSLVRSCFGAVTLGLLTALAALVVPGAQTSLAWAAVALTAACVRLLGFVRAVTDGDRDRREARTDDLTGLGNRRAFVAALDSACAGEDLVAVALLDLDRFKEVNDRHGHGVGDRLLQATAVGLAEAVPPGAVLTRLGGDEFAVVLTGADAAAALRIATGLARAVDAGFTVEDHRFDVGASIGVATSTGLDDLDGAELLRRADAAMYLSKADDRDVTLYDDEIDRAWQGRADLTADLAEALSGPVAVGFEVHYQPQLATGTGAVVGVEALVRWNHPRLGLLGPGAFLGIVEERGLMPALTAHVARTASADLATWRARGLRLRLSINTSPTHLSDPQLLEILDEVVAAGVAPTDVVVEVTETTLMRDPEQALRTCHEITARGCALSIDDFGTGYSSLAYLANLPVSEVKIDRSFTARALADDRIAAIVAGTVELARHLGLRTVAEGVEDPQTLDLLRRIGCDESQGYWHSRPLPADELLRWVESQQRAGAELATGAVRS